MPRPSASRAVDMATEVSLYRRQLIVREAAMLFFERGYQATTMDDIAVRLNVTKPMLYAYFPSKAALLFQVCQGGMNELLAAVDRLLLMDMDPADKLSQIVAATARAMMVKQAEVAIFYREAKHLTPTQASSIHRKQKTFDAKVAKILEDGVKRRVFDVGDPALTAMAITGMLSWMFSWYGRQHRLSDEQLCDGFVELALRMVHRA
jgi:AcrR family transcriptional regulator